MTAPEKPNLPAPTSGAARVATLSTGIAAAFASVWFPTTAALGATALAFAISKYIDRPQRILLEQLRTGDFSGLRDENLSEFIPMGYRFFEAAKEGEYEHTLKVLAAFIAGELGEDVPDAGNFARIARRLEGISLDELRVLVMVSNEMGKEEFRLLSDEKRKLIEPTNLHAAQNSPNPMPLNRIRECAADLSSRGFLVPESASRWDKSEEFYWPSEAFYELLDRAGAAVEAEARGEKAVH